MFKQPIVFFLLTKVIVISGECGIHERVTVAKRIPNLENKIPNDSIQNTTESKEDEMECTRKCAQSVGCKALFYNKKTETCQLYWGGLHDNDFVHFSEAPGYNFYKKLQLPIDCYDILMEGKTESGVYTIYPSGEPKEVFCDQDTDGGGWLVFQRRRDGSEEFFRGWNDYANGFGNILNEFWLGNCLLARITSGKEYTLRVDLESFENETVYAVYDYFAVGPASSGFTLYVENYSGTVVDSLLYHNGSRFSTFDNDLTVKNCASVYKGAWWFNGCHTSNLNGEYFFENPAPYAIGVVWMNWKTYYYSLKTTEMKIRPAQP